MQSKDFLLIFFSILLAVSEAGRVRSGGKQPQSAVDARRRTLRSHSVKSKPLPTPKGKGGSKKTPLVDASKFTTDPTKNPRAKDPTAPVGTENNPAAIHYDPKTQGDQTEIIRQNARLGEPYKLQTTGKKGPDVRADRYKAHEDAKPGKSKEDQPPASFGDLPGDLFNIEPSEQEPQRKAILKANQIARKEDGYVQQIIYSGSNGNPPDPIPKKKKARRDLLARSLLAHIAAHLSASDHVDYLPPGTRPQLYARFMMDNSILAY